MKQKQISDNPNTNTIPIKVGIEKYGNVYNETFTGMSYAGNVWNKELYCPTLNAMGGGGRQPMIIVYEKHSLFRRFKSE